MLFNQNLFVPVLNYAIDVARSDMDNPKSILTFKRTLESLYCKAAANDPQDFENQLTAIIFKERGLDNTDQELGKALVEKVFSNFSNNAEFTLPEKEMILLLQPKWENKCFNSPKSS